MKRKFYSLLLLAVFVCSILTACGGSGGSGSPVSVPNGSYSTKNNEISTGLSRMYTDYTKTGTGDRVITGNGWYWDYTYYYKLHIDVAIKNTGNVAVYIDDSLFSAYWDDSELSRYSGSGAVKLVPGEQTTVNLVYSMSKSQYDSWNVLGHTATLLIQYGDSALAYVYSTENGEITVIQ